MYGMNINWSDGMYKRWEKKVFFFHNQLKSHYKAVNMERKREEEKKRWKPIDSYVHLILINYFGLLDILWCTVRCYIFIFKRNVNGHERLIAVQLFAIIRSFWKFSNRLLTFDFRLIYASSYKRRTFCMYCVCGRRTLQRTINTIRFNVHHIVSMAIRDGKEKINIYINIST